MGKQFKPSSDNVYDVIASVTLSVVDNKADKPCKIKLYTTSYNTNEGHLIPEKFALRGSGECRKKKSKQVYVLDKVGSAISLVKKIGRDWQMKRRVCIALLIDAYRENPDDFIISFKVVPVRGNKADYDFIYKSFGINPEQRKD